MFKNISQLIKLHRLESSSSPASEVKRRNESVIESVRRMQETQNYLQRYPFIIDDTRHSTTVEKLIATTYKTVRTVKTVSCCSDVLYSD